MFLSKKLIRSLKDSSIKFVGGKTIGFPFTVGGSTSLTDLTGGIGNQPQQGDIVFVFSSSAGSGFSNFPVTSTPIGYTLIGTASGDDSVSVAFRASYKIMTATPDTSLALHDTGNSANGGAISILVFRNFNPTIFDATSVFANGASSALVNPPPITPVTDGAIVIAAGASGDSGFLSPFSSMPNLDTTFTAFGDDSYDCAAGCGFQLWQGGTWNGSAWSITGSDTNDSWTACTIALKPL